MREISLMRQTGILLRKDFLLDMRNKASVGSAVLYAIAVVYIAYLSLRGSQTGVGSYTALVWVILSFAALNGVYRSFSSDGREMHLYLYTLASPRAVILSKILYNLLFTGALSLVTFGAFVFFVGLSDGVENRLPVLFAIVLTGSIGFASVLTMVSAIAARANNNPGLMAVLSLPLLLPLIIALVPLTAQTLDQHVLPDYVQLLLPAAVNVLAAAMGYLLFPYLWRD
jgi:heme exporter protein B